MKIIAASIILLLTLPVTFAVRADDSKLKRDVTYSTHNYKHSNKAATARQWEFRSSVTVSPVDTHQLALNPYKHAQSAQPAVTGITVAYRQNVTLADRNYKAQPGLKTNATITSDVATKHEAKSAGSGHTIKGE